MSKLVFNVACFLVATFGLVAILYERYQTNESVGAILVFLVFACILTVVASASNIKTFIRNSQKMARKELMRRVIEKQKAKY